MRQAQPLLFTDYLKKIPSSFIFKHLLGDRGLKRRIISPSLLDDVKDSFSTVESLQKRFDELSDEARVLCAQAYAFGRRGVAAPESRFLFDELIESFLVYGAEDDVGNRFLIGFDDLADQLLPMITAVLLNNQTDEFTDPLHPVWVYQCLNDCVVFISLAGRAMIKLTQQGKLARGSLQQLERILQGFSPANEPSRNEKNRKELMHLLMAYLRENNIIYEEGKLLLPDYARVLSWNDKGLKQRWEELFRFFMEQMGAWRLEMLDCAQQQIGEEGFCLGNFGQERESAEQVFRILYYFGYIEAGKTRHGHHRAWRKRTLEPFEQIERRIRQTVILMPDFSAILPPDSSPQDLFTFSLFGQYTNFDQVYKGMIDKTILHDSLSKGFDADSIMEYLDAWNAPDNVRITIREWIREFSRLFMSDRTLIVSNDPKTSMQLQSYEPLKKYIEPVTSDMVFSVKAGTERQVRDMLQAMGFDTRFAYQQEKRHEEFRIVEKQKQYCLTPIFQTEEESEPSVRPMSVGKYSTELKELELGELFHVIDFAILMGYQLRFEYEGSPSIPEGEYTVVPRNLHKGMDPAMDARQVGTVTEKRFDVRKIQRIGVHPV
ncbi:MAG: hypothetical protein ACOC41_07840 [Chitinivibrionales bacterium]